MRVRAFTLIELLAVVAIVVIVLAIILASLRSAGEEARRVSCLAKLRSNHASAVSWRLSGRNLSRWGWVEQLGAEIDCPATAFSPDASGLGWSEYGLSVAGPVLGDAGGRYLEPRRLAYRHAGRANVVRWDGAGLSVQWGDEVPFASGQPP